MADDKTPKQENPAKHFWSGLDYITGVLHDTMEVLVPGETVTGIRNQSIVLSVDEWGAIEEHYASLERALLDTWEDAVVLVADLDDMKSLPPDELENYRKADVGRVESIMDRLRNFVDDDKVEV